MYRKRYNIKFHKNLFDVQQRRRNSKEQLQRCSPEFVISNREEIDILSKYILDYTTVETGGQLFGYWTQDGKPVVLFVLGPGPNAKHDYTFFSQDLAFLSTRAKILRQKYGLYHIGEWHSHHQLGLDHPSFHDAKNMIDNIHKLCYSKFLLCIGTCTETDSSVKAFMFTSIDSCYKEIPWSIKDTDSPFRQLINKTDDSFFNMPSTIKAQMKGLYTVGSEVKLLPIQYQNAYWLKKKGNSFILNSIVNSLKTTFPLYTFNLTIDEKDEVHMMVSSGSNTIHDILFPLGFPQKPPIIIDANGNIINDTVKWRYDRDIYNTFINYYKLILC